MSRDFLNLFFNHFGVETVTRIKFARLKWSYRKSSAHATFEGQTQRNLASAWLYIGFSSCTGITHVRCKAISDLHPQEPLDSVFVLTSFYMIRTCVWPVTVSKCNGLPILPGPFLVLCNAQAREAIHMPWAKKSLISISAVSMLANHAFCYLRGR